MGATSRPPALVVAKIKWPLASTFARVSRRSLRAINAGRETVGKYIGMLALLTLGALAIAATLASALAAEALANAEGYSVAAPHEAAPILSAETRTRHDGF
jgi:hypothetical protein